MKKSTRKGGPGSGPHSNGSSLVKPGSSAMSNHNPMHDKPNPTDRYHEQPASRNPGKPRAGVRPSDLYPERAPKS